MTLKKKILIGYGVAFALMGLVVAWAITNLFSLGKASDAILSENYRSVLAAENMVDALERQDSGMLIMFLGDIEKGIIQFRENEAIFFQWLARAKDNITIKGEANSSNQSRRTTRHTAANPPRSPICVGRPTPLCRPTFIRKWSIRSSPRCARRVLACATSMRIPCTPPA